METLTDYLLLWRQIVNAHIEKKSTKPHACHDVWTEKARQFHDCVLKKWKKPDSSRGFMVSHLDRFPGSSVLDIGAGSGAWSCLMAKHCRHVTAVEPSAAMIQILKENMVKMHVENVTIVQGAWPDVDVEPHDVSLCSHALYGYPDFERFIQAMKDRTRRMCALLLRAPIPDGIMAQASRAVWDQPYDSPNFQIAYNALMQMGIFADVQAEDTGLWEPWTSASLEDALTEIKAKFGLADSGENDVFFKEILQNNLIPVDGHYRWPRGVRSMLATFPGVAGRQQ
jgi:SAM-dependent methyltransferase